METRLEVIRARTTRLLEAAPEGVETVAAAKTRSVAEIAAAVAGGIRIVGHNYVQEAAAAIPPLRSLTKRPRSPERAAMPEPSAQPIVHHMIGHLQRNKAKRAAELFDAIQTVDSLRLARAIDRACEAADRSMTVLIEINAAREPQKGGVAPDEAEDLIREIAKLPRLRIDGLMTMGPLVEDPERLRPVFAATRELRERIRNLRIENVSMATLSMGMSDSYRVAIEEGSTMIRLGTLLFGPRDA